MRCRRNEKTSEKQPQVLRLRCASLRMTAFEVCKYYSKSQNRDLGHPRDAAVAGKGARRAGESEEGRLAMSCDCAQCRQHYKTLGFMFGLPSESEIQEAYREAIKQWHPDLYENYAS